MIYIVIYTDDQRIGATEWQRAGIETVFQDEAIKKLVDLQRQNPQRRFHMEGVSHELWNALMKHP